MKRHYNYSNPMPLVHHSRRLRRQFGSNPFVTGRELASIVAAMTNAYMALPNNGWAKALKVEIDLAETVI